MIELWTHIYDDFANLGSPAALAAFGQVILIDVMLAADNAIVVGALAAGLPPTSRRKVVVIGIAAALVLRVVFALAITQLMQVVGLVFAGGLLLIWVAWKMWREMASGGGSADDVAGIDQDGVPVPKSFAAAAWSVAIADVSMSLDNVLAVAGAARAHPGILMIGLMLSVALMGLAANLLARVIGRYRWVAYIGLFVILYVAIRMIVEGWYAPVTGLGTLFS